MLSTDAQVLGADPIGVVFTFLANNAIWLFHFRQISILLFLMTKYRSKLNLGLRKILGNDKFFHTDLLCWEAILPWAFDRSGQAKLQLWLSG